MKTSFVRSLSPVLPPNTTALLSSTAVKVQNEDGGGLSPVVAGELHASIAKKEETIIFIFTQQNHSSMQLRLAMSQVHYTGVSRRPVSLPYS